MMIHPVNIYVQRLRNDGGFYKKNVQVYPAAVASMNSKALADLC